MFQILVLNLGSTSTKVAIFNDEKCHLSTTLRHTTSELAPFNHILDQIPFRKEKIEKWLEEVDFQWSTCDIICVRGGVTKPLPGGIYAITQDVVEDIKIEKYGSHVTNVGNIVAYQWGQDYQIPVIFVDSPVTDEFCMLARYSGYKGVLRRSVFHALNQKQIARQYAFDIQRDVNELYLIVCHMGGGISVGAHRLGQVIDVNNALDGEGPFSPERTGSLSTAAVLDLVDQFRGDIGQVKRHLIGQGGLTSYCGTNNVQEILLLASTDAETKRVIDAMIYQIAKEIGAMATVLEGRVDQILLTGGLAYNEYITHALKHKIEFIAPVTVYPGEDELKALAFGALRYLRKEEECQTYS